jgi:hypothetical protein
VGEAHVKHVVFYNHRPPRTDTVKQFITQHEPQIIGVLNGWDRVRFRGTLRILSCVPGLFVWMLEQKVLLKEFAGFSKGLTDRLKQSIEAVARAAGRKIEYLASSSLSKEALVQELLRREKIEQGLVCVLSCVEPCRSFDIQRDPVTKHIDLASRLRKCLHWHLYFIHMSHSHSVVAAVHGACVREWSRVVVPVTGRSGHRL